MARPKHSNLTRQLGQLLAGKTVTKVEVGESYAGRVTLCTSDTERVSFSADGDDAARLTIRAGTWQDEDIVT